MAITEDRARTFDSTSPATGEVVGTFPVDGPQEVAAAVARAREGQLGWAGLGFDGRRRALLAYKALLVRRTDELVALVHRENGKPDADALIEVLMIVEHLDWAARNAARVLRPRRARGNLVLANHAASVEYQPLGVVGVIGPWNYPVFTPLGSIVYALAAGNAVVFKPSELTPAVGCLLADTFAEAVPAHPVLQVVTGDGATGHALCLAGVDKVALTGSPATGRKVMAACAERLIPVVLELGGKDAMIVDAGVDPEWAAEQAAIGAFANAGQICTSVERIYVHRDVAEPFVEALTRRAEALQVGDPRDPGTEMGPLIDDDQVDWVHNQVEDALHNGAELRAGGRVPDGPGCFYPPTVLVGPPGDSPVITQETFGPVAAVRVVGSFAAALEEANRGEYGLAAVVLTPSHANAQRAWRELEVGTVKVNAVFGGAPGGAAEPRRSSGHGFGYGPELLDEVTHTKVVHLGVAPPPA